MNFNNSRLIDHKPMKFGTFVPYMFRFVIIVKYLTNSFKLEWNLEIKFTLRFFFLSVYIEKLKIFLYVSAWLISYNLVEMFLCWGLITKTVQAIMVYQKTWPLCDGAYFPYIYRNFEDQMKKKMRHYSPYMALLLHFIGPSCHSWI